MQFTRNKREIDEIKRELRVVGLTGGIASGKTVATVALRLAGFTVIDADEISRELTAVGAPAEKRIAEAFNLKTPSGNLDRKALRLLISTDKTAKKKLDELTHPLIIERIKSEIAKHAPPIVLSAPLLFETALSSLCDAVVCVFCPKRIRVERIIARDGMSRDEAERMIDMQLPDYVCASLSEFCIPSDGDIRDFERETIELFTALFNRA